MKKFKSLHITLWLLILGIGLSSAQVQVKKLVPLSSLERSLIRQGFVNIQRLDSTIIVDLKYGTTDNFTKTVLYDGLARAYLHPLAADKLVKAQQILKGIDPNLSLLVYDGARPLSVQRKMYDKVKNTSLHAYVANPDRTGLHNYGMAVDLTICDKEGNPLDMGTPFDFFGRAAGINMEEELIQEGKLTRQQVKNRKLLRQVMIEAGFLTIRGEWWHFNAVSLYEARSKYKLIE
jgi:D-alanyl-D-alanine dipeptidase